MKFLSLFVLMIFAFAGCSTTASEKKANAMSNADMKKIVEERNLIYDKAMVEGDSVNLVEHFSSDCVVLPPNGEQIVGKAAIVPAVMAFSRMGIKKFTDETTRVLDGGEYIIEEGNYFLGGDNNSVLDKGKYVCVWKKEDNEWRVCSNIWNTSLPMVSNTK